MSHPAAPKSLEDLRLFRFERVLNEDPFTHTLILLGHFERNGQDNVQAIIRIERSAIDAVQATQSFQASDGTGISRIKLEENTDIYTWMFAWFGERRGSDVKLNIICPATETHIQKYTKQTQVMVRETPELYHSVVRPYIDAFPPARTKWVENILNGISEQSKVLYQDSTFVLLPDMKWDLKTLTSLYLVAIVKDRSIKCLRDLRRDHIPLLQSIQDQAMRVAQEKWGLPAGSLRMYVHYQPSYYHFHVHIVNVNYEGGMLGMTVGHAHLLDDIISLLGLDPIEGDGCFQKMTLTYGLGSQHGLLRLIQGAQNQEI